MRAESFNRFCARHGFVLTPGQSVVTSVCFDGVEPGELSGAARDVAREQFGDVDTVPSTARAVVVWKKGARIGGSRMAALRIYQLGLTLPLAVAPGEPAYGLIVGPDMRLARHAFAYALGAAKADAEGGAIAMVNEGSDAFMFQRHDGHLICIECLPATRGGSAVRGRTLVGAVMTEGAFFRDAESVVNDEVVFRGIVPRVVPGGQVIIESTPWTELGLLYTLFTANYGMPSTCIAAHLPTLVMRPDEHTRSMVARERERDPENALQEFDAIFRSSADRAAFRSDWVARTGREVGDLLAYHPPVMIIDSSAGRMDSWVWAICQWVTPYVDEQTRWMWTGPPGFEQAALRRDETGAPLLNPDFKSPEPVMFVRAIGAVDGGTTMTFDSVVAKQASVAREYGAPFAHGDQYQKYPLASAFARHGVAYMAHDWTNQLKIEAVARLRSILRDEQLLIERTPHGDKMRRELCGLEERVTSGGALTYGARRASHDDYASVLMTLAMCDAIGAVPGSPIRRPNGSSSSGDGDFSSNL